MTDGDFSSFYLHKNQFRRIQSANASPREFNAALWQAVFKTRTIPHIIAVLERVRKAKKKQSRQAFKQRLELLEPERRQTEVERVKDVERRKRKNQQTNLHHMIPKSKGGAGARQNLVRMKITRHNAWHKLFELATWSEIISLLRLWVKKCTALAV